MIGGWSLIVLFGTNKRVELLNSVSPNFFKLIHDILWEYTILGLARITDGAQTGCGKKVKKNLSIKAMKRLLSPEAIEVSDSIFSKVEKSVEFCRDWRNKHIAHRDLYYILQSPKQLKATRKEVEATMSDIAAVMNAVAQCYQVPPTMFDFCIGADSTSLLSYLDIGRRCSDERWKRLKNGLATPADYKLHSI